MKKSKVTIYQVAEAAGVSISTVSRALKGDSRISKKTRDRVRAQAAELGFQKNAIASSLSTSSSRIIGVIVSQLNREFLSSLVHSIEETAFSLGYSVIICQTNNSYEREKAYLNTLSSTQVAGLIATLSLETASFEHFRHIREQGIPVVLVDRVTEQLPNITKIVTDDFQGAYRATQHLVGQGYRRIAYVSGPTQQLLYHDRLRGYRRALQDADLPCREEWIAYSDTLSYEDGPRLARTLLQQPQPPDAIFTANNLTAISIIACAQDMGWDIPRQLGVIGFSEEPFSALMRPSVSSVPQPSTQMGQLAVEKLIEEINCSDPEAFIHQKIMLDVQIIARESTRKDG